MTQQARVSLNQWLITAAVGVFGIWGGYSVLQYRVGNVEEAQKEWVIEYKIHNEKDVIRFEDDRRERAENEKSILLMNGKLTNIEVAVQKILRTIE